MPPVSPGCPGSSRALFVTVSGAVGDATVGRVGDQVAVWQVAPTGLRSGAWTGTLTDNEFTRAVPALVVGRAVAGLDRDRDMSVLAAVTEWHPGARVSGAAGQAWLSTAAG